MRNKILITIFALIMILASLSITTIYADGEMEASISINEVTTPLRNIDLTDVKGAKSIDVFVGDSVDIKTDIIVSKYIVIEDKETLKAKYYVDDSITYTTAYSGDKYDISDAYIRRETTTITPTKEGTFQMVVEYQLGDSRYFDSINIVAHKKEVTNVDLAPNTATIRTNAKVSFDYLVNGSNTLSLDAVPTITINGEAYDIKHPYSVSNDATKLDIVITYNGKDYTKSLEVIKANALESVEIEKESYGFLLSDKKGTIMLDVTADSYPNIAVITDSATLLSSEKVDSVREGYDRYALTLQLDKVANNEKMLIRVDDMNKTCQLNIIDNIYSIAIVPESTKFESGKNAVFHVVINGVKDVDTAIKWSINGTVNESQLNVLSYKSISSNDIKVTAEVGGMIAEYSYKIDTSTSTIILTVVASIVVILICIPILIALKKNPKPNLKALIKKNNKATIERLTKLKATFNEDISAIKMKSLIRILTDITRDEKRAQQESFECENKAFGSVLTSLAEAKNLTNDLLSTYKTNPKDVSINIIDNIIYCLESANTTIDKVVSAMGE